MVETQLYALGVTALWFYDYLLTLADEVAEFYDDKDAERKLITLFRSGMHGKRRALSVGEPSHLIRVQLPTAFQYSRYFCL